MPWNKQIKQSGIALPYMRKKKRETYPVTCFGHWGATHVACLGKE